MEMISDAQLHFNGLNQQISSAHIVESNNYELEYSRPHTNSISSTTSSSQFTFHQQESSLHFHSDEYAVPIRHSANPANCTVAHCRECQNDEMEQYQALSIIRSHDEQYFNLQEQQKLQQQNLSLKVIPILKHLKVPSVYMLAGDILVDLDSSCDAQSSIMCSFSALNSYKNLTCIEAVKSCNSCEISLTQSTESLTQFAQIVDILEKTPDRFTHEFGLLLRQYQSFVNIQQQKAVNFQHNTDYLTQIVPMLDAQYVQFIQESREYVARHIRENPVKNQFHVYMMVKANTTTFIPDISRIGLSNELSSLLGGSQEELSWMLMHHGLFEFFSKETRNQLYYQFLSRQLLGDKAAGKLESSQNQSITLVTLDGIEIEVNYAMEMYFGENPESNVMFFYPHQLIMISFDIPEHFQNKIANARSAFVAAAASHAQQLNPLQLAIKMQRGNVLTYSRESQSFLEMHYADRVKKIARGNTQMTSTPTHSASGSGCGRHSNEVGSTRNFRNSCNNSIENSQIDLAMVVPKQKRKYKKHPKSQHLIDFRKRNGTLLGARSRKPQSPISNTFTAEVELNRAKSTTLESLRSTRNATITQSTLHLESNDSSSISLDADQNEHLQSQFLSYRSIQTFSQC